MNIRPCIFFMKNVAIIMAAGHGSRIGGTPKQFLPVNGKMMVEYAIQAFQEHPRIDEIMVMLPQEYLGEMEQKLRSGYSKISCCVAGGAERFQSSWEAIRRFSNRREDRLLLHDAARPLLSARIIDDVLLALERTQAAVTAVPATDTILKVSGNGDSLQLDGILPRKELYCAQTPQAFQAGLLCDAFGKLMSQDAFVPTDESGVVAHFFPEIPIEIVQGEADNFKVTYSTDLERLELLVSGKNKNSR